MNRRTIKTWYRNQPRAYKLCLGGLVVSIPVAVVSISMALVALLGAMSLALGVTLLSKLHEAYTTSDIPREG